MRLLLALLFIVYANAQSSTFTATILYSEPSMKGGALNGTMVYDYNASPNPSYFLDFSSQVYSALFQFNTLKGVTSQKAQWVYRYGPGCPGGCETGAIDTWMPKLFIDSSYTNTAVTQTINGVTCTKYVPSTANSLNPVSSLWVTSTQKQCMVQFTNGNQIVFTSVTSYASSSALPTSASASFTPKLNCSCGKPIDVSIVIDRSGSISPTEFKQMVSFMNSFINTFKIGPNQTQVALTTFNTKATQLLPLSNNADTVYNAINAMTCSSSAYPSCQTGGTSISAGLQRGADLVAKTATGFRSYATHVIIVLTDGVHNTIADSGSTYCYRPCTESNGDILSYTSCGDSNNNYIPDDWEPSKCSTNCTDFTCKNPTASCSWTGMAQCHRDLINAREYAFNVVGDDLIVFSVGIGPDISVGDLNIITDNRYRFNTSASTATCTNTKTSNAVCINNNYVPCGGKVTTNCYSNEVVYPERVIVNSTFDTLNSKLLELSSRVCDSNAQPCGDCCGYCKCGTCTPPDVCPSSNFCDEPYKSGACCAIRNRTCTPRNPCETAACNRNANAGAGGCEYTPVQCQAADACYSYACNPSKAVTTCDPTFLGQPASDLCHISGCIDGKLVSNQPKVCTPANPDPCQIYSCNLTSGACYSTPKALPTPPNCFTVSCDSSSTNASYPFVFSPVVCPSSGDKCQPNLCDASTGKCELNPIDCITDKTNLCDKSKCVDGVCVPEFTTCSTPNCKVNCSCVTSTGVCQCKDKLCAIAGCIPQFCNTTTNTCQNETATCPLACATSNCPALNNQCFKFKCVNTSDPAKIPNCDDVTATTCSNNGDNCLTNCRCDNSTGCVCDPVTCAAPAPCFDLARNSSLGGAQPCCQYTPRVCPTDLCSTTNCSTTTDSCVLYPICPQSDKCYTRGCSANNGSCYEIPIPCVPSDNCQLVVKCDPVLGCSFAPKDCSDKVNCTVDSCDVDGNCQHDPIVCNDNDPCTNDQCDEATGTCTFIARTCDDSNVCTTDTCDKSKTTGDPCVYTPIDVATVCEDNNKCTDDTCDPTDGCKHTFFDPVVSCPTPTDPCSVPICIDTFGCTTRARTCAVNATSGKAIDATYFTDLCDGQGKPISDAANATVLALCKDLKRTNNTDCSYTVCTAAEDGSYYNCTLESRVCDASISSTVIVAATLGSAVIAGIVIAVIVAVGACGGASYAAYQKLGNDAEAQTHTSPLYVPSAKGGANALYQPEVN